MNWFDIIIGIIILLSFAGPAIGKILQGLKKQREKEIDWRERAAGGDMEDVAEQRRRELMRQRQAQSERVAQNQGRDFAAEVSGTSATQAQQPAQPGNMTMAERIARARAKAEYERRSRQLGQPSQRPPSESTPQEPDVAEMRRQEAQRQHEAMMREREEAQAREAAERQRQQARRRQQQQQQQTRRRQQQMQQRAQREAALRAEGHSKREARAEDKHRSLQASAYTIKDHQDFSVEPHHIRSRLASRRSLREAIVLREILDKPVSLRPPRSEIN